MSTTLKVLDAKNVIATHQIQAGEVLTIEAVDNVNYQLINDQTGLGPQNIIAKREGKDLIVFLEDGNLNPDVVIKNYYGDEQDETVSNLLVGQHENGNIYAYVPESGMKADAVSLLAEEAAAPQALGGESLSGAFWAFNPWWLLALVPIAAGIAIAAHNNSSSDSSAPADPLAASKTAAKQDIDNAAATQKAAIDASNASDAEKAAAKAQIDAAAEQAKATVDSATTADSINTVKDNGVDTINNIGSLAIAKDDAKAAIDAAAAAKNEAIDQSNASEEDKAATKAKVAEEAQAAKDAIDAATTTDGVNTSKNNGVDTINNVDVPSAAEDPLKADKDAAKADVQAALDEKIKAIDESNGSDEDKEKAKAAAQKEADEANKAIDDATTPDDVTAAKDEGVEDIGNVPVPSAAEDPLKADKDAAKADVQAALDEKIKAIDESNGSDEDKEKAKADAQKEADNATKAIDDATTPDDVKAAKDEGVEDIGNVPVPSAAEDPLKADKDAAKADVQAALDEKIKAIDESNGSDEDKEKAKADAQKEADEANKAIDDATTPDGVTAAKDEGVEDIGNVPVPTGADDSLKADKDAAKADVQAALDEKIKAIDESNGSDEDKEKAKADAQKEADEANKAIDDATTPDDVTAAKDEGVKDIGNVPVPSAAEDPLKADKDAAKADVQAALDEKIKAIDESNGSDEDKEKAKADAQKEADDATKAIDDATTPDGVTAAKDEGVENIDNVPVPTGADDPLKADKDAAKADVQAALDEKIKAIDESNGSDEDKEKAKADAQKEADDATKAIDDATTPDGVTAAKDEGVKDIGNVPVPSDTTAPTAPEVTANDDGSVDIKLPTDDAKTVTVKVPQDNDTEVTVTLTKGDDGNWTSDNPTIIPNPAAGADKVTIPADNVKDGGTVSATATDAANNESTPATAETKVPADITPPAAPTLTANDDGTVDITLPTDDATSVKISVPQNDGTTKEVTLTKGDNGQWTSSDPNTIPNPTAGATKATIPADNVKDNATVTATAKDAANNESTPATAEAKVPADITPPAAPTLTANDDGTVDITLPTDDATSVKVSVPQNDGTTKEVTLTKGDNGQWTSSDPNTIPNPTAGADKVTIPADNVKDNATVTATAKDAANNESTPATAEAKPAVNNNDSSTWVDTSDWVDDGSTAEPADNDPRDDNTEDDTVIHDPNMIITGRNVPNNPSDAVMQKIKDKNPDADAEGYISKTNNQAQFVTGSEDDLVVVGKGTNANDINGKNSITNGVIRTNDGKDTVIITNNAIRSTIDTGNDVDTVDVRGNVRGGAGPNAAGSTISTGSGDDVLTVRGRVVGTNNNIDMGDGADTVVIAGGTGTVNSPNTVAGMQAKNGWNKINLGEGDDKLSIGERGAGTVQYLDIQAGTGDDTVILAPNRGNGDLRWVNVDLGEGNDHIIVKAANLRNVWIDGGNGNDVIDLSEAKLTSSGVKTRYISSRIYGGDGDDEIILGDPSSVEAVNNTFFDIQGGAGNDIVTFTKSYDANARENQGYIQGGEGTDTVRIINEGTTVNLYSGGAANAREGIVGFEAVDMTAAGSQTVKITQANVLANSGSAPLFVSGDASDRVEIKGFTKGTATETHTALDGQEHSYTAYTSGTATVYVDDNIAAANIILA